MRYKNNCLLLKRGITISVGNGKTVEMNKKQEQLYEEYRLIQYDIVSGKQYSLENQFFKEPGTKITLDFCPRLKTDKRREQNQLLRK